MKTLREKISVMQAALDGKNIQFKHKDMDFWSVCDTEPKFAWSSTDYRIKPEPRVIYVNEWEITSGTSLFMGHFNSREEADTPFSELDGYVRTIKFIEVLED